MCVVQDMQSSLEEEQRARDEARESYNMAERRCTVLGGEVEELRNALEGVSRIIIALRKYAHIQNHRLSSDQGDI